MRLKLYILTILISNILFINCTKVDGELEDRKKISFSSTIIEANWATKGATGDNLDVIIGVMAFTYKNSSWGDYGGSKKPNLMYNGELKKESENWTISPTTYWPSTEAFGTSFFAYSPRVEVPNDNGITLSLITATGTPIIDYQMPVLAENQPTLMFAEPILDKAYDKDTESNNIVELKFHHALAAVGFKIKGNMASKIKTIGIKTINDFGRAYMQVIENTSTNKWEVLWPVANGSNLDKTYNAGLKFDEGKDYVTVTTEATNVTADDGYLMVIPQTTDSDTKVILTIENATEGAPDITREFALGGEDWVANNIYIYILNI